MPTTTRPAPRRMPFPLLALPLALAATGCADPLAPEWDALHRAEERWAGAGPARYQYVYTPVCFCPFTPRTVVVEDGVVTGVEPADPAAWSAQDAPLEGFTVEELLARTREGLARPPHDARLAFHPTLGYPEDVWFDPERDAVDEEWGFTVTELVPLP